MFLPTISNGEVTVTSGQDQHRLARIDRHGGSQTGQPGADDQDIGEEVGALFRVEGYEVPLMHITHGISQPPLFCPRAAPFR